MHSSMYSRLGAFAHEQKRCLDRQNDKILSMSVQIEFTATTSKEKIYHVWIEQKKRLPSRDRTAGLKITEVVICYNSYSLALFQLS